MTSVDSFPYDTHLLLVNSASAQDNTAPMMDAFRRTIPSLCPCLPRVLSYAISHLESRKGYHKDARQTTRYSTNRKPKQVTLIQHRPKETVLPAMQRLVLHGSTNDGLWITHRSRDEVPRSNALQQSKGLGDAAPSEATFLIRR